jgi:O-antigen/teichoic acid export membrane protein
MPFMGMGIFQSFLKYAPIQKKIFQRRMYFKLTFKKGLWASIILSTLLIISSPLVSLNMPESLWYTIAFSLMIITLFIFESVKNYLRVFFLNKAYARLEITHALMIFILGMLLSFYLGVFGFIVTLVIVPLILSLYLLNKKRILTSDFAFKPNETNKEIWWYGIYTSIGGLVSQLIYSIDIISIGNILEKPESLAQYKALSLIPFSLIFLPSAVFKTDFVKLVQESKNWRYMISYAKNFMLIFLSISSALFGLSYFFGDLFIQLVFGKAYTEQTNLFLVFMFGIIGAFTFRIPFGNILVAIGWTKISTILSIGILVADIILNYFWIHNWGIIGAAYATSLLLWVSGILTFIVFLIYIGRLKKQKA